MMTNNDVKGRTFSAKIWGDDALMTQLHVKKIQNAKIIFLTELVSWLIFSVDFKNVTQNLWN